ncbi:glyoxalase/bleomycin resistance/extradiol dioxygenase family protein [Arthrobacter sp. ISL-72]|uniref:VOC family protein n=1 Tax=Arthrobacter sp. ISL-72 TaxID=2819114 RepID=UPI001BE80E32|nr:VOC family protein [Arthrobacter sp. ISL-72]MBT2593733.1 VOC family protein [Arthrobacter sp. ISL-72]
MAVTEVIPYLYYEGADAALDWMEKVLGFGPSTRWRNDDGVTEEAEIVAGGGRIAVSGSAADPGNGGGLLLIVHVDDVDAQYSSVRAATDVEIEPPADQPYGPRTFTIVDPWGYQWNFWQGEATPPE